jgi:hypothetical protein
MGGDRMIDEIFSGMASPRVATEMGREARSSRVKIVTFMAYFKSRIPLRQ